ncbi:MAG: cadherin repeat domain-containing protein, partial [Planctomycetia bacterium]|nr:cadherin repeat domain-containing protein [Planctomycetia bacterium]
MSVANTVATLGALTASPEQLASTSPIRITGTFAGDAGVEDAHTIQIEWGDGRTDRLNASNVIGIASAGTGYSNATSVAVTGGSGTGMTVNIATDNGQIVEAKISTPGTGYQVGDAFTVTGGGANARLTLGAFNQSAGTFTAVHAYAFGIVALPNPTSIRVTLSDDDGGQDSKTVSLAVLGAPTITSTSQITVNELQIAVIDMQATDSDGDTEGNGLAYSITGGADQAKFAIVPATGVLSFNMAPDFESPQDAGANNVYDVQVTVTDAGGLTGVQNIAVTIRDIEEGGGETLDFGDAMDSVATPRYPTLLAHDGA